MGHFPEMTAFERYAVKTSEKANMHNRTGLIATHSVYLGGSGSHNEYRLLHAIYYSS